LINATQVSIPHEIDAGRGGDLIDKEPPVLKLVPHIIGNHQEQDKEAIETEEVKIKVGCVHQEKVDLEVLLTYSELIDSTPYTCTKNQ
jgi:hypothetical protein